MPTSHAPAEPAIEDILARARSLHRSGDLEQAANGYRMVLSRAPGNADALYLLGLVLYRQADLKRAINKIKQAIGQEPKHALAHASLAQIYQDLGKHDAAVKYFQRAAQLDAGGADLYNGLGLSLASLGRQQAALETFLQALELKPNMPQALNNLGNLQRSMGDFSAALKSYSQCLQIRPDFVPALNNLGVLYQNRQQPSRAIPYFQAAIDIDKEYAEAHNNLGAAYNDCGQAQRALRHFRRAIRIEPGFAEALINAGMSCQLLGQHSSARAFLDRAVKIVPDNLVARWVRCVSELESVYDSPAAIEASRSGYRARLAELAAETTSGDVQLFGDALALVGSMQPFLLPYQGGDDCELQSIYGDFICHAIAEQEAPLARRMTKRDHPERVGIVSAFFYDHSNWKVPIQGWLKQLAGHYQVNLYHTGSRRDRVTDEAEALSSRFYSGLSAQQFARAIRDDANDVLLYPEVGMHPVTAWLASQRLAEVQCASWGHPVTTGLPSMDYFLSSELMEPGDAECHYREKLIRLPGLSFSWTSPGYDETVKPRREKFDLRQDETVYLCVQNLSKYLPQHDHLLVEIAKRVPQSRLVFIAGSKNTTQLLKNRLQKCFRQAKLDFGQKVLFLPRLNRDDYHALNRVADVFLDTPGWSGCNSSLEALSCSLPVVTIPGRWMRSRHSYAIYKKMQYETLIADSEQHYIELAVRLAEDSRWLEDQRRRIASAMHRLIGDDKPALALVELIPRLIQKAI
jgi:predicted O-linked N-acetylglucosamine transferase (SPINDLY family)